MTDDAVALLVVALSVVVGLVCLLAGDGDAAAPEDPT